jgi:MFS family permease
MALVETGMLVKSVLPHVCLWYLTSRSEIAFILVATFPYLAPGGYRALLIGPMLEGLCGGLSTITATINAYLSDVTPDGSRAAVYARLAGIMMVGFASGPVLGSLLIKWSGNM